MLDAFIPEPRLVEIDQIEVAALPARAYEVARHFDNARSPIVRALFGLRTLPDRLAGRASGPPRLSIDDIGKDSGAGFRMLADEPGRGFAVGAIGRFWESSIPFVEVEPSAFADFIVPGVAKVAWELRFEPYGDAGTRIVMELRLDATDDDSWRSVRRYFRLIGPFSRFIRHHLLDLLAKDLGTLEAAERTAPMPGDDLLADASAQTTHGITIDAEPEAIWPWLVQMGCRRAGWYSWDRLDNGGKPSEREIVPELQSLRVGDVLPATPEGADGFEVLHIEAPRVLVLGGLYDVEAEAQRPFRATRPSRFWQPTWAFVLERLEAGRTRLHVRARVAFGPDALRWRARWMRPIHHFMETEQLRNLKRRAEGELRRDTARDVAEGIVGALGMLLDLATPFLRRRRAHWGLSEAVANRAYPGDEHVPAPKWSWTHGIEIDAPPAEVYPWIAQIGCDKAGFYSYQWLENLAGCDLENAARVHPEWTHPTVGGNLWMHPSMPPMKIVDVEPGRHVFALVDDRTPTGGTLKLGWLFYLEPLDGGRRTRFVSRFRSSYEGDWRTSLQLGPYFTESIGFVMDRRMLLGVKERVEAARLEQSA
jgi:hypothetical protein